MKTNHQRGFVDPGSFRDRSMEVIISRLTGAKVYIGNDFTNGRRGHAKAVHGAKKRIRTSDRFSLKTRLDREQIEGLES